MNSIFQKRYSGFIFFLLLSPAVLLVMPFQAAGDLFPMPPIDDEVAFVYRQIPVEKDKFISENWGFKFSNTYSMTYYKWQTTQTPKKVVMVMEGVDREVGPYIVTMDFIEQQGRLKQTRFTRKVLKYSGEAVLTYEIDFEKFRHIFPPDSYASEIIGFLFRGLDKRSKSKFTYYWWASEKSAFLMNTVVKRPKRVTVPAGKFTCYPIELYANIADFMDKGEYLNKIVNPFMPDQVLYFDVNYPHYFINYEGPMGPPGSMEIKIDLVKIIKGRKKIEKMRQQLWSPALYANTDGLPQIF